MNPSQRTDWKAFSAIALGTVVVPLDSAVNVAFPAITAAFAVPPAAIQWVIVCYVIANATLLLVFGRLGDLFGHAAVFRFGLAISALAFFGSAMAATFEMLLATRALQGVGAAMVLSCGPALATAAFPAERRVRALANYAAVLAVAMTLGPSLGGLMVDLWGWSAVFWFRLPIALTALAVGIVLTVPSAARAPGRLDAANALALAAALAALLIAISRARATTLSPAEAAFYAAVLIASVFVLRRSRGAPDGAVIAFAVFRDPRLSLVTATGIIVNLVAFALMLLVPFYLARMTALPVSLAGLLLAASPLGVVIGGQCAPHLAPRLTTSLTAYSGAAIVAGATAWIATWQPDTPAALMGAAALAHGIGLGLYQVAQLDITTATLPPHNRGVAGALVMLTRTFGVVLAATTLTALFVFFEAGARLDATPPELAFRLAFRNTFLIAAGALATVLAVTLVLSALWSHRPTSDNEPS